jgi:hypothetical protein
LLLLNAHPHHPHQHHHLIFFIVLIYIRCDLNTF